MTFFINSYAVKMRRVLLLGLVFCFILSCSPKHITTAPYSLSFDKKVFSHLIRRREAFHDLRGKATVTVIREAKKETWSANLVFDSYSRLRIEGLGFLNTPYFFLMGDGEWLWFYLPEKEKIWRGEYSRNNFARLTGIRSNIDDLMALLSGNIPCGLSLTNTEVISLDSEQGMVELESDLQELYRLWIDQEIGVIEKMEIYGPGQVLRLIVSFDQYELRDNYYWPKLVECNFISSPLRLRIKYKQIFLNEGVTENLFHLSYPPSTSFEDLDDFEYPDRIF